MTTLLPPPLTTTLVTIPGCALALEETRDEQGRLTRLAAGGTAYVSSPEPGRRVLGDGLAELEETGFPGGVRRRVTLSDGQTWVEHYRWDRLGRPTLVDGVMVERDATGRVVACLDSEIGGWRYRWEGPRLVGIEGPFGARRLWPDADGRPTRRAEGGFVEDLRYDADGARVDVPPPPAAWHRDEWGRLLAAYDARGRVRCVWLWDGLACVGRIDGPPGAPLAAAFCLDSSGTPVRVVTSNGCARIPRDAFGESLLAHPDVPGLYGGAVAGRFVHYRGRALDPATGSWCAPDPWHGGEGDPRRRAGDRGALTVEVAESGPWSVAAGDPIGRVDPTGEVSVPLVLSDLTWSLQTNLGGWLGMEFTLNFWYSIFAGTLRFEGLSASDRSGSYGVNLSGMFDRGGDLNLDANGFYGNLPPAWTYGHIVWCLKGAIDALADVRVFVPSAAFQPTLYGSLLRIVPASGSAFLLAGNNQTPALGGARTMGWTRGGGKSVPVVPGSPVPSFPSGGFHFDTIRPGQQSPTGTMTELVPAGPIATGTVATTQASLTVAATGLGLRAGNQLFLAGTGGGAARAIAPIETVTEEGGQTRILLSAAVGVVPATDVRARLVNPDGGPENLNAVGAARASALATPGSTKAWAANDVLQLSQGGSPVGVAVATGLEAQLTIDASLPAGLTPPLTVVQASVSGASVAATAAGTTLTYASAGAAPLNGAVLLVKPASGPGAGMTVVVKTSPTATTREVDRDLTSVGASVTTQLVTDLTTLGTAAAAQTTTAFTYQPAAPRQAPSTGPVKVTDSTGKVAARLVTALAYDALIVDGPLPGTGSGAYSVQRFTVGGFDRDHLTTGSVTGLNLAPGAALDGSAALQLLQFSGPAVAGAGGSSPTAGTLAADTVTFAGRPGPPASGGTAFAPGQLTVLADSASSAVEAAVISSIRMTVTLDRALDLAADGFDLVAIAQTGSAYDATRVDNTTVTVLPSVGAAAGATPVQTQMPHIGVGELVQVSWSAGGGAASDLYRVTAVDGATLTLADGIALPAAATPTSFTVRRMVPIGAPAGSPYSAAFVSPTSVTVNPSAAIGGAGVGLTGLGQGQQVEISWTAAGNPVADVYLVTGNAGAGGGAQTITLTDGQPLPAAGAGFAVRPLTPAAPSGAGPGTVGVALVGRNGTRNATPPANTVIDFDAWQTDHPANGRAIAIVDARADGKVARPARVVQATAVVAHLGARPAMTAANVRLQQPALAAGGVDFAASFTRSGNTVSVANLNLTAGTNLVAAIPFRASALTAAGTLSAGTVLIPDDPESIELDRKQAVVEHELEHTKQTAMWGPLLLSFIPLGLIEGLFSLGPDAPRPGFSAYVSATVPDGGSAPQLVFADTQGVTFATGDSVQVSGANGVQPSTVALGATTDSHTFALPANAGLLPGSYQVRKVVPDSGWNWFDQVLRTLTQGGLLELVTGSLYGGLIVGVGELFYALGRLIVGRHSDYPASAATNGAAGGGGAGGASGSGGGVTVLHLDDEAGRTALAGTGRVVVTGGNGTVTRTASLSGENLTLGSAIDLTAPLRVAPYSTRNDESLWDWHSWYPASVPDASAKPALVKVEAVGDDHPSFAVADKVSVHLDHSSYWAHVTAVHETDQTVELDQAPGNAADLRIAKLGSEDPLQDRFSWVETTLGMGWMRWLFDPYGQLFVRIPVRPGKWEDYVFKGLRYLLGSKSWGPIPFIGYWFLDNARHQITKSGWRSSMEQGASKASGDTYCTLAVLDPDPGGTLVVGDVVRYRVWGSGGNRALDTILFTGQFDTPGVMLGNPSRMPVPQLVPFSIPEAGVTANEPNRGAGSPSITGTLPVGVTLDQIRRSVPDALFQVFETGGVYSAGGPAGFMPTNAGWVPTSGALERTQAIYAAFSQPSRPALPAAAGAPGQQGGHRITVADAGINANGSDAQRAPFPNANSNLFFDVNVTDVTATVGGSPMADGGTLTLVLTQRAAVAVTPGGDRRYSVNLLRPAGGTALTLAADGVTLVAGTPASPASGPLSITEPVEISRVYRRQADGTYDGGAVAAHGLHLPGDLHVPVRAFSVTVTDTVPFRGSADPAAATVAAVNPGGEGFALVPAAAMSPPRLLSVTFVGGGGGAAPVAGARMPAPTVDAPAATGAAATVVGSGVVMHASFAADDPPDEPVTVVLAVTVGTATAHGDVKSSVTLNPWFRLTAASYAVARGSTLDLAVTDGVTPDPATVAVAPAAGVAPGAAVTVAASGPTLTVTVPAGATPGRYEVTARDAANAAHRARRTILVT